MNLRQMVLHQLEQSEEAWGRESGSFSWQKERGWGLETLSYSSTLPLPIIKNSDFKDYIFTYAILLEKMQTKLLYIFNW